ncbi:MAG: hypothetical protein FD169_2193 [Bacillota bacterium]|nr:MAG: hypothetical protein FD169_2193 [Bacillota bacterium]MBS3950909.1 arsenic efflux protein [Peptococcaceae bacterium]
MLPQIIDIIIASAEGAFIEVGVFVGAVLLLFGYINYKQSGAFVTSIENSKQWQPLLGALLGLTPGCGGAIFVMPLFFKGTVTFGTVVATLVATMGDSAFVLIATHPKQYFVISVLSFITAIITGYAVDQTSLGAEIFTKYKKGKRSASELVAEHRGVSHAESVTHIGHSDGDEIDLILHHKLKGHQDRKSLGFTITHNAFQFYWVLIGVGLVLGVLSLFQINVNDLSIPNLALVLGVTGTALSVLMMVMGKKFLENDTHEETELKAMSLKETLIHNAQETAFVITWVFVGFLTYELLVLAVGGGNYFAGEALIESLLLTAGIASVFLGALTGLIPGCGPQIIFVALFARGLIPFAALFANAVSQDGDALLPLIALDRRSALWATLITTVPAIIFGLAIYWFEVNTGLGALLGIK